MRAIVHDKKGNMRIEEVAAPIPRAGEVVIKVASAGVNRPDILQRLGAYPAPPDASPLLGLEVSGTIAQIGEPDHQQDRMPWQIGDTVCALTHGGGYAEYVAVDARQCLPVPSDTASLDGLTLGAISIETSFTVWHNLFRLAKLQAGESVLIHGGASGIGTMAIQLAKWRGATVSATVGTPEKAAYCQQLGADETFLYPENDWGAKIRSSHKTVDVVLDMVGGDFIQTNLDLLAPLGRYAMIGFMRGPKAPLDMTAILRNQLQVTGSRLRAQSRESKAEIARAIKEQVWPLFRSGTLKNPLAGRFALENAHDAHHMMENGLVMGKVVIDVAEVTA
ncbi:MAG: NAD(P)H-quinone oxidoreductase [Alphaproteobacteria bacterium]|nr:NAD(P)H-quinone oxidoreductase [Alphaproteobacteria bacterium]